MEARRFPRDAVATAHYLASASGLAVLADGGNAVDAAIAANLTLGVVTPYACGYGGDLFAVVWDGALHGYLGSGRSPAEATRDDVADRAGTCLLYTSDAADDLLCVDLGGRRIIKKKKTQKKK